MLLAAEQDRTGIPREQLLLIVGKSALVRHLATTDRYKDKFVLKGGTLLYHAYKSPRASFKDADYAYTGADREVLAVPTLAQILTIEVDGFHLYGNEGRWTAPNEMFEGLVPFSIEAPQVRHAGDRMKITVSVRAAEQLDPSDAPLYYEDRLLAGEQTFLVNGLTRDELAAEKILAWAVRKLAKHYVDLAILARDHEARLDRDRVLELVREKFAIECRGESTRGAYQYAGLTELARLPTVFDDAPALRAIERNWDQTIAFDFRLLEDELEREDTLVEFATVKRLVGDCWLPTIARLR